MAQDNEAIDTQDALDFLTEDEMNEENASQKGSEQETEIRKEIFDGNDPLDVDDDSIEEASELFNFKIGADEEEEVEKSTDEAEEKEEPKAEDEKEEEKEEEKKEEKKKEEENEEEFVLPDWANELSEYDDEGDIGEIKDQASLLTASEKIFTKYKEELQANDKLVELFQNNAPVASLVKDLNKGDSFEVALLKAIDIDSLKALVDENDPNLEPAERTKLIRTRLQKEQEQEASRASQEKLVQEFNSNVDKSNEVIAKYAETNKIDKAEYDPFLKTVESHISNVAKGLVSPELLDLLYKGATLEKRLEEVRDAAKIKGRNDAIKEEKTKKRGNALPSLPTSSGGSLGSSKDYDLLDDVAGFVSPKRL